MAIDKPTVLALATAFGYPDAAIALVQIPDASPLHVNGEWVASLARFPTFPSAMLLVGPVAYGATEDAAAQALYAAIKLAASATAQKAATDATAAQTQATAVNGVVTK
jgi:hypothetical protein